jgi:ActR/RegA family two-component response regulator
VAAHGVRPEWESSRPRVLIIDDDVGTCESFELIFRLEDIHATSALTGSAGIECAKRSRWDAILIDQVLPDMSGTDVVAALRESSSARLLLMSAFLTVDIAVLAIKLGAADALAKPLDIETLLRAIGSKRDHQSYRTSLIKAATEGSHIARPHSVVERWVYYVTRVCDASTEGDFKTLQEWAHRVGVSYTSLCETHRLLGIRPLDGRDFARVLKALISAITHQCSAELLLDVSDRRVLRALAEKAGIDLQGQPSETSIREFIERQQFVAREHEGLRLVRRLLHKTVAQTDVR